MSTNKRGKDKETNHAATRGASTELWRENRPKVTVSTDKRNQVDGKRTAEQGHRPAPKDQEYDTVKAFILRTRKQLEEIGAVCKKGSLVLVCPIVNDPTKSKDVVEYHVDLALTCAESRNDTLPVLPAQFNNILPGTNWRVIGFKRVVEKHGNNTTRAGSSS